MQLKEILSNYKNIKGISNDALAKELGVTKSAVSKWLSGDVKKVKQETLEKINKLVGYDIEPFLNGTFVEMKKPILGYVKAGYNLFEQEEYLGYETITLQDNKRGDYFLKVVGDSMVGDGIMEDDLAFIKMCDDVPTNTIAVVSIAGEEVTIKRVIKKDGLLLLEASNPKIQTRIFTQKEIEELPVKIIGKVVYSKTFF